MERTRAGSPDRARSYVEQLYGGTGRCLAYVTRARGNRDTDTSLMQLQARLSPSRIGSELIVLLGLEHLIDGERASPAKLADAQQRLADRIDDQASRAGVGLDDHRGRGP